jgi:hypothetical protein
MPFDSDNQFAPIDPNQWARLHALPRIVVHPKQPLPDGIDDWLDPGTDPDGGPNDWFVPPTATPIAGQVPPDAQPNTNFGSSYPAVQPDPFAAYWSQVPASRIGALAWAPPYLPSNTPPPLPVLRTPTLGVDSGPWLSMPSLPGPTIPTGGPFDGLATLGTSPAPPIGGMFSGFAKLGTPSLLPAALAEAGGSSPAPGSTAPPPMPSTLRAFWDGLRAGSSQVGQSVQSFSGPPPVAAQASPAAQPLGWSDLASPSGIAPKVAYQFAQSYPTLAGGVVGGVIGGRIGLLAGPGGAAAGALIVGGLGAAALSAAQTLGPVYAAELQKNPNDPEGAWDRAWKQAEITGAFSGAAWAAFPARFFQSPVKQLVFQIFGAQPALAVGQRVTSNIVDGRPATEGIGEAYGQGVVGTAVPALGHTMVRGFLPTRTPVAREESKSYFNEASDGLSPAQQLRARRTAQLKINSAAGRAWEKTTDAELDREKFDVAPQLTVRLPSKTKTKLDFVIRDRVTGEFGRLECKASDTAPVRPSQARGFREMEHNEATVVGKGKPGFPRGMKIPPGKVEIRRPGK